MMTIRLFFICMLILLLVCIGCMFCIYGSRQAELNHKQHTVNILWAYKLNEPALREQIATLEKQVAELEKINVKYQADELYIDVLESRYLQVVTYANVAEIILKNNGINFTRIKQ